MEEMIAVVGANGKMGTLLCSALQTDFKIIKINRGDSLDLAKGSVLVIDFASAKSSVESAIFCSRNRIPLIIGSTGQSEREQREIEHYADSVLIIKSGSFSIGIAMLKMLCKELADSVFGKVVLIEKHHSQKKDAPSGTAKEICEVLSSAGVKDIDVLSVRAGQEIGTHEVNFYFGDEKLCLSHEAFSRQAFVRGVRVSVNYALNNRQKCGIFGFDQIVQNTQNLGTIFNNLT